MVRSLLSEVLFDAGYSVEQRDRLPEPSTFRDGSTDLLILDIPAGPRSREIDCIGNLVGDPRTTQMPILVLCKSRPAEDIPAWIGEHGVAGLLLKPFDLQAFLDAVESALESGKVSAPNGHKESRSFRRGYKADYDTNFDTVPRQ